MGKNTTHGPGYQSGHGSGRGSGYTSGDQSGHRPGHKPGHKRHILAWALAAALLIGVCGCQKAPADDTDDSTTQGTTDTANAAGGSTGNANDPNASTPTTPDTPDGSSTNGGSLSDPANEADASGSSDPSTDPSSSLATPPNPDDGNAVIVYVPSEQADVLTPVGTTVADDSDQALVDALIQAGALPEGVEVLSASEKDGTLALDMNQAFADAVRSSGSAGEAMRIYSLVNTFIQARDVDQVTITIEGGLLESGHDVYDYPLEMSYLE